jgi:uncharacterized membrane protein YidH (DUF202 family)
VTRTKADIDRGLARERTALAWSRSALSLAALGALLVRIGAETGTGIVAYPLGVLVMSAAGVAWLSGRSGLGPGGRLRLRRTLALRLIAAATIVTAAFALVLALVG